MDYEQAPSAKNKVFMAAQLFFNFLDEVDFFDSSDAVKWSQLQGVDIGFVGLEGVQEDLINIKQIHSANLIDLESSNLDSIGSLKGDGLFTKEIEQKIAVKTADCLPVLFCQVDSDHKVIQVSAVHAGWRGLEKGILFNAVKKMYQLPHQKIFAAIGPHICSHHYEVDRGFYEGIVNSLSIGISREDYPFMLRKKSNSKWNFDLRMCALLQLRNIGLSAKNISCSNSCTYGSPHRWNSYRRTGDRQGRNWSWIKMNSGES